MVFGDFYTMKYRVVVSCVCPYWAAREIDIHIPYICMDVLQCVFVRGSMETGGGVGFKMLKFKLAGSWTLKSFFLGLEMKNRLSS